MSNVDHCEIFIEAVIQTVRSDRPLPSDTGGETLARAMTLIESAKMSGLDPQTYLADVPDRIHDHKMNRLDELLP